ncbi:MAG: nitrogenase component 1 [Methanomassiliicoccaceae archaeon]|nr:nitrogenase component 1 [Methanomassiliicoccaceae archaeon]
MSSEFDRPEGILGISLAFEGISDAVTIMNGPTGCKSYPAWFSEHTYPCRDKDCYVSDHFKYYKKFFFTQPRVPCTYMDSDDYIMGTCGKLDEVFEEVKALKPKMIGMINSPGASLIGETLSLKKEEGIIVRMESPQPSVPLGTGFQDTMIKILDTLSIKRKAERKGVNILGMSVWDLGWEDSIKDLKDLLALCGIKVNTVVGAGCSVRELKNSGGAELNVIVHRDMGIDIAKWYERELDVPYVESRYGAPIGFDALEDWLLRICEFLNKDPSKAMRKIKEQRERAAKVMLALYTVHKPTLGRTFSVAASGSIAYPVTTFLYSYLGLLPVSIFMGSDRSFRKEIQSFIEENDLDVSEDVFDTPADVMIGDGDGIASAEYRGIIIGGFDMVRPSRIIVPLKERPVLGLGGTMRLLDGVMNIIRRMD